MSRMAAILSALLVVVARTATFLWKFPKFPKTSAMAFFRIFREARREGTSSDSWGRGFDGVRLLVALPGSSLSCGRGRLGQRGRWTELLALAIGGGLVTGGADAGVMAEAAEPASGSHVGCVAIMLSLIALRYSWSLLVRLNGDCSAD